MILVRFQTWLFFVKFGYKAFRNLASFRLILEVFVLWFFWVRIQSCFANFEAESNPNRIRDQLDSSNPTLVWVRVNISQADNQQCFFSKNIIQIHPVRLQERKPCSCLVGISRSRIQIIQNLVHAHLCLTPAPPPVHHRQFLVFTNLLKFKEVAVRGMFRRIQIQ